MGQAENVATPETLRLLDARAVVLRPRDIDTDAEERYFVASDLFALRTGGGDVLKIHDRCPLF